MKHFNLFLEIASFLLPFWLSILLFVESKYNKSRRIMAAALLHTSIIFFGVYFFVQEEYSFYYYLHSLNSAMQFAVFPVIYIYIKTIISKDRKVKRSLWHFLPTIVMFVVASWLFYVYFSKSDLIYFLTNNRRGMHFTEFKFKLIQSARLLHLLLVLTQGVVYSIMFAYVPKHYNEQLKKEFSNIEHFSLEWIHQYNLSFVSIVAIGFIVYAIFPLKGYTETFVMLTFFTFSAYVCVMGLVSLKQQVVDVNFEELDSSNDDNAMLGIVIDKQMIDKLTQFMEQKQLYLDAELSLTTLSRDLGTNRTYLSALINQQFGMNFNAYVNHYRVKYVTDFLANNPNATKAEIFQQAGFGSLSTLKRAMSKAG